MSKTVYNVINKTLPGLVRHDGDYGIEIETETQNHYSPTDTSYWMWEEDGSLRNFGIEYISKQPIPKDELSKALEEFDNIEQSWLPPSISNSVHVHKNVLNIEPIVVANVLTTYIMVEPILCKFAGPLRESNLFCLQVRDAQKALEYIMDLLTFLENCGRMGGNYRDYPSSMKYSALNIGCFYEYGSIEFRALRGTTDISEIQKWINIIEKIFEFSQTQRNPKDVFTYFQHNMGDILDLIFHEYALDLDYNGATSDIESNLWFGWRVSESSDWNEFGVPKLIKLSRSVFQEKLKESPYDPDTVLLYYYWDKGGMGAPEEGENYQWVDEEPVQEESVQEVRNSSPQRPMYSSINFTNAIPATPAIPGDMS